MSLRHFQCPRYDRLLQGTLWHMMARCSGLLSKQSPSTTFTISTWAISSTSSAGSSDSKPQAETAIPARAGSQRPTLVVPSAGLPVGLATEVCGNLGTTHSLNVGLHLADSALTMYAGNGRRSNALHRLCERHYGWYVERNILSGRTCRDLLAALPTVDSAMERQDVTIVVCMLSVLAVGTSCPENPTESRATCAGCVPIP